MFTYRFIKVVFNGYNLHDYFRILEIKRSILPSVTNFSKEISGIDGEVYTGTKYDTRKITLSCAIISRDKEDYLDTIKISSHLRYKYFGIGLEYTGSIYTVLTDNTISNNTPFYNGLNIDETIDHLESSVELVIFWVVWIIVIIAVVIGFYYLDNKWLEDKK